MKLMLRKESDGGQCNCCEMINKSYSMFPKDYLDMVGLSGMFPRVEVYLIQGSAVGMLEKPPMEG
jgi:hypothetical protein